MDSFDVNIQSDELAWKHEEYLKNMQDCKKICENCKYIVSVLDATGSPYCYMCGRLIIQNLQYGFLVHKNDTACDFFE